MKCIYFDNYYINSNYIKYIFSSWDYEYYKITIKMQNDRTYIENYTTEEERDARMFALTVVLNENAQNEEMQDGI